MTKEERYQYILRNHMGKWRFDNIPLFKEASETSGCSIKVLCSGEKDYIWLIRGNKKESYKRFWVCYRILLRDKNK